MDPKLPGKFRVVSYCLTHLTMFAQPTRRASRHSILLHMAELFADFGGVAAGTWVAPGHNTAVCQYRSKSAICRMDLLNVPHYFDVASVLLLRSWQMAVL